MWLGVGLLKARARLPEWRRTLRSSVDCGADGRLRPRTSQKASGPVFFQVIPVEEANVGAERRALEPTQVVFDQDEKKDHRNRRRWRVNRQLTAKNRRSSSRHDHIYRYISIRITKNQSHSLTIRLHRVDKPNL